MPSTAVHLAVAALVGAGILGEEFDARALAVVLVAAALPDLDTFLGLVMPGTHRAALHTLLIPAVAAAVLAYDTRLRDRSLLGRRGPRAVPLAWVAVAAYLLAGIGPDLFANGVNALYPIHDGFYRLSGNVLVSNQRGFVQTVWELGPSADGTGSRVGTTATVHYSTGVDPTRGREPANVERVFPIARGGLQVLLILVSIVVTTARLWRSRKR